MSGNTTGNRTGSTSGSPAGSAAGDPPGAAARSGLLADRLIGGIVLALATGLALATFGFPPSAQDSDPGTGALPRLVAGALGVLGILLLLRPEPASVAPAPGTRRRMTAIVVLTVVYVLVVETVGFPVTTFLFLVGAIRIMGVRRVPPLLLVPLLVTGVLYYLFAQLLAVYLPAGILEGVLL